VAGEAEQVATIMDKFMNVHAGDHRCRAFFGAHEIDCQQEEQSAKDRPWQKLSNLNGTGRISGAKVVSDI
jgi:hypothetical protein